MPSDKKPQAGPLVAPRVRSSSYPILLCLLEVLETEVPDAIQELRDDVYLEAQRRLGAVKAGRDSHWSEGLELWKSKHNLHRWTTTYHEKCFDSVVYALLFAWEIAERRH